MAVVVFGSINMDLVVQTPQLPKPGQTLIGHNFTTAAGGKGANQAVACARLGAQTRMIGCVGNDSFGTTLKEGMASDGIDVSNITTVDGVPTGVALISVDDHAENTIIIVQGTNGQLRANPSQLETVLGDAKVLLLQLEVDLDSVIEAAKFARTHGVLVILDPAPARPLPDALYLATDVITPNESEAELIVGFPVKDEASAARAAHVLLGRGPRHVIIKMGSKGAYHATSEGGKLYTAFRVNAIDTVAAGDAFNGGLASALDSGLTFEEAIRWGLATAAISVTRSGAQSAMPTREEMLKMLNN